MGQIPAKGFLPSAPYGASPAANAVNPVQPAAMNPQTPLLPPNFTDPGKQVAAPVASALNPTAAGSPTAPKNPFGGGGMGQMFGRGLFGL